MPTYEYECEKCPRIFELFQSMTEEPVKECSECGGPVRRLIGAGAGIIFKGSGFYATDYRSPAKKEPAEQKSNEAASAKVCPSEKGKECPAKCPNNS